MNFKAVKKYFLTRQIEQHLKEATPGTQNSSFKTVGILVNAEEFENTEIFSGLIEALEILNKDLKLIIYKEEKRNLPTFDHNKFSSKDFTWNGSLNKPGIEEFVDRKYDIFIGYYSKKNKYLEYITSKINADVKVGLRGADKRLFDIIFKIGIKEYPVFEQELAKYIRIFKNKKETA
tara:strand:- start:217513 stop:218043 length:531 start_codon:yes stop_codon:yes gene_type:complete